MYFLPWHWDSASASIYNFSIVEWISKKFEFDLFPISAYQNGYKMPNSSQVNVNYYLLQTISISEACRPLLFFLQYMFMLFSSLHLHHTIASLLVFKPFLWLYTTRLLQNSHQNCIEWDVGLNTLFGCPIWRN